MATVSPSVNILELPWHQKFFLQINFLNSFVDRIFLHLLDVNCFGFQTFLNTLCSKIKFSIWNSYVERTLEFSPATLLISLLFLSISSFSSYHSLDLHPRSFIKYLINVKLTALLPAKYIIHRHISVLRVSMEIR